MSGEMALSGYRYAGTRVPRYGTRVPRYAGTRVRGDPGTRGLGNSESQVTGWLFRRPMRAHFQVGSGPETPRGPARPAVLCGLVGVPEIMPCQLSHGQSAKVTGVAKHIHEA
eukprot:1047972-Rhodomonas_salina.1